MPKPRVDMVCSHCKSDDVLSDAYAEWDTVNQRWELAQTFHKGGYCKECDGECGIEEKRLKS